MRRSRGSWWWAQISRVLVYLALGIVSGGLAVWVSSRFSHPLRLFVLVITWILGVLVIDIRVRWEPVTEEEIEKCG